MSEESTPPVETNPDDDQEDLIIEEVELDEVETLKTQLADKEEEINGLIDKERRSRADMDNFRKRIIKEKADAIKFANEQLLKKIIPISENLDRALSAPNLNIESLKEGVEMIVREFHGFLEKVDVKTIPALGETFDPSVHEAVSQIESDEHEENFIMEEYAKGYSLNGRVLIPAKVVIAKSPVDNASDASLEDGPETLSDEAPDETETTS